MNASYVEACSIYFPTRQFFATGNGYDYAELRANDELPLPTQAELDVKCMLITRDKKWREIQAERDRRVANGVKIGANWYHSDVSSRIQQIGLVIMGAGMPTGIMWKTLSGGFVPMTPALAGQIFQASGASDMAIFAKAEYHKAMMNASANPTTYDYSTGWPPTFRE